MDTQVFRMDGAVFDEVSDFPSKRDYFSEGKRAFGRGKSISTNPYRYGRPAHYWLMGWIEASDDAQGVPKDRRLYFKGSAV